MELHKWAVLAAVVATNITTCAFGEAPYSFAWSRQLGTPLADEVFGISVQSNGDSYLACSTEGNLAGTVSGSSDSLLLKYNSSGTLLWSRQFGSTSYDQASGVSVDASGNVFVGGGTGGDYAGTNQGGSDAFLAKYDANGALVWKRQLGSHGLEGARAVVADNLNHIYSVGETTGNFQGTNAGSADIIVYAYDSSGNLLWSRQRGTSGYDTAYAAAANNSGLYLTGYTDGNLGGTSAGGTDTITTKYDALGNIVWSRLLGTTGNEAGYACALDAAGNLFVGGLTTTNLGGANQGSNDVFLAKYDVNGNLIWTRHAGSSSNDLCTGLTVDSSGNVYVAGRTDGNLGGQNKGDFDVFILKYDSNGSFLWSQQYGTADPDINGLVGTDSAGNLYLSSITEGSLASPNAGGPDIFIGKLIPAPEPASLALLAIGSLILLNSRRLVPPRP